MNMTDAELAHVDKIIENAFELMKDVIANPSTLEAVPNQSTIEITPIADVIDDDEVVAWTERFAIKVVATR